jgi:hypothetical protein
VNSQKEILDRALGLCEQAVAALDRDAVPVWLFLNTRFHATKDIRYDYLFQFVFRSYYRLDNAGLTPEFKDEYFKLLQRHRAGPRPVPNPLQLLRHLCEELEQYETKNRRKSLQFVFATKLLATIDKEQPVYDSFVAFLFNFRRPDHLKDRSKRLDRLLEFYELLSQTSRWLPEQEGFSTVDEAFAQRHQQWDKVPLPKRVDLILWATGKAAVKAGA